MAKRNLRKPNDEEKCVNMNEILEEKKISDEI